MKVYYNNGILAEERNVHNGQLSGAFKRYMPNGKPIYEMNYKDNEENGTEKTYDKDGVLLISKDFYMGIPHGLTIVTDPATHKTTRYTYHYGDLINVAE